MYRTKTIHNTQYTILTIQLCKGLSTTTTSVSVNKETTFFQNLLNAISQTVELVLSNIDKPWSWANLCSHQNIRMSDIESHMDLPMMEVEVWCQK